MNPLVNEKIRVQIYGRNYELDPGGLTPLEANRLAATVDQRMRDIATSLNIVDTQKIAVLAALNLSLELSQQKAATSKTLSSTDERVVEDMISTLDEAIA